MNHGSHGGPSRRCGLIDRQILRTSMALASNPERVFFKTDLYERSGRKTMWMTLIP